MNEPDESANQEPLGHLKGEAEELLASLGERKTAVLELAAQDLKNEVIAAELGISERMVAKHLQGAREKLGQVDNDAAVRYFVMLRKITGTRTFGFRELDFSDETVERWLADLPYQRREQLRNSPEFKALKEALQAPGPGAWRKRYGRWGTFYEILLIALLFAVLFAVGIAAANGFDTYFGAKPS
ncbi:MAG: helix-turn-helix transcriptional regulator [Pseudomonadota bacterium]